MTTRLSNVAYLTVMEPAGLDGVGWSVRVLSERDYASVIADVPWFAGLGFTVEANAEGGASVTLDADDSVFTAPLPLGETTAVVDQEALWQILEDGLVRFEFLAEDVDEDVVPASGGPRTTQIAGRGTASVLEWAPVLPAGMPAPATMQRTFTAAPMAVWFQLFAEAQADGYLEWVTLTFDGVTDSQGVPWGPAQSLSVSAGENLLDLLKRWCEVNELTWRMLPGFRLEVRQAGGLHLEDSVVFTQYRSQGEHKRKISRRDLANVIFADRGDLGLTFAEDGDSVTKWRKRAAWISAGESGDGSAASMIANTSLGLSKDQKLSRTVRIVPDKVGRQPFRDFGVHDWIGVEVPDSDTEGGARKVVGLAVEIDADGVVDYEATLSSRFEVRAVKMQRLLDKLGGSSASETASPVPVSKAVSAVSIADLSDVDLTAPAAGSLLQLVGGRWVDVVGNLDLLADVDTSGAEAPTAGQVLTYDAGAGLWKPATPAGGGGGSSAAPSIRATSTNYAGTGNTASVTVPGSAVVGDLLLVAVGSNYGYTNGAISAGWAVLPPTLAASFHNMNVFWKVCTAGDIGATPTFVLTGSEPWNTCCAVVKDWTRVVAWKTAQSTSGTSLNSGTVNFGPGKSDLQLLFGTARVGSRVLTFGRGALVVGRTSDASLSSTLWSVAGNGVINDTLTSPISTSGLGIGAVAIG